jgi:hypothetical protein
MDKWTFENISSKNADMAGDKGAKTPLIIRKSNIS